MTGGRAVERKGGGDASILLTSLNRDSAFDFLLHGVKFSRAKDLGRFLLRG